MNEKSYSNSYKAAGVDVTAGYKAVELMKEHVKRTNIPGVLSGIGGFGGLFQPEIGGMKEPVLVSGTDGVGTKLKVAMLLDKHDTIGIDAVAMCVNDVVCCGAQPLFFLDYIACGKNVPEKIAQIVAGVAEGCVQSGCALIGGETAEHPGMMPDDDYDVAGFTVGIVDKEKILDGSTMQAGDVLIGLASTGVHSNGFSLVRKVFNLSEKNVNLYVEELGATLGETLLTPTKIYVKPVLSVLKNHTVRAISHVTGGGFYENIPRMMRTGSPRKSSWRPSRSFRSSLCSSSRARSRSATCTTPSTWASACAWRCRRRRPTRFWRISRLPARMRTSLVRWSKARRA